MAKRKLSKQQQRRIASQQKNKIKDDSQRNDDTSLDESSTQTARVISHHGRQLYAETESFEKIKCKIRQNLGEIACGDYIVVQQQTINNTDSTAGKQQADNAQYVVIAVKERSNLLVKSGFAGAVKPVAANIGQLVIVTSLLPKPNPYLIDRYLTAAENLPAKALIIINKIDLLNDETKIIVENITKTYNSIGYDVISASIKQDLGLTEISEALSNTTSILVGLSGVGKSSIVKAILPKEEIRIGATSEGTGEGKHTTTVSAFYHLEGDGIIIDSPGVRDFTPINNSLDEITHGFKDVRAFNGACKFSNCSHINEPNCAMKQAVAEGKLNEQRFNNYLRLIQEFNESD